MRDIPVFTTPYGSASLILREIPYKEDAYIRVLGTDDVDSLLRECAEFNDSVILLFGAIKLGFASMDEEDFCAYGLCCETKLGEVKDSELEKEIADFKANLGNMLKEIFSAPSPEKKIEEINARQEEEASQSMQSFDLEMRKMKLKLYGALGALALFAAAMIIVGFII